jgi:uncharacterized membrane protein
MSKMVKRIILLLIGLVIWIVPALVFKHIYNAEEAAVMCLFFGWFPALVIMMYLEEE